MLNFRQTYEINIELNQHKNKKHSVNHTVKFSVHKITANSPKFNDSTN